MLGYAKSLNNASTRNRFWQTYIDSIMLFLQNMFHCKMSEDLQNEGLSVLYLCNYSSAVTSVT